MEKENQKKLILASTFPSYSEKEKKDILNTLSGVEENKNATMSKEDDVETIKKDRARLRNLISKKSNLWIK